MIETLLWLIIALTGLNVLGGFIVMYWCWRCGSRAEQALQGMQASTQRTADNTTRIEASARYIGELAEQRFHHADELRRQELLVAAQKQRASMSDTMPLPALPGKAWLGDQAMLARRRPMRTTDALRVKEQSWQA